MSKSDFLQKIKHAKEKLHIIRERLGVGKQIGFREERSPKEVLQHWEAIRRNNPVDQLDLQNVNNNYDPTKGSSWMCLVHMARSLGSKDGAARINVLKKNFENQIRTWDAVSTSLISNKSWEHSKDIGTIGVIGYVLNVPSQNILVTNESDGWIENHIGREGNSPSGKVINSFALVDHLQERSKIPKTGYTHISKHEDAINKKINAPRLKTRNFLLTPSQLQAKTAGFNEVLVIGRPGINVYENMPPTAEIKVSAILLVKKRIPEDLCWKYIKLAKIMSAANNNVPILYINEATINNPINDQIDYLASTEGLKTIKYVYDKFLSKPYTMVNLPGCPASNWDVFLDTPGRRVHRPNHGLVHTLRVANAVKVIAEMYNSRLPKNAQIPPIIIYQQQFRALFSVIGRLNDVGFKESEAYQKKMGLATSMYDDFHKVGLAGQKKYLKKGLLYVFSSPEAKAITKLPLNEQNRYEKLGNEIYRAAHNIDLMRCYDKIKFNQIIYQPGHDGTKCLKQMIGDWLTGLMLKYHREVISATGDRCWGYGPNTNYNLNLFGKCSQDFTFCLNQIENVDKYTYDEGTYYF